MRRHDPVLVVGGGIGGMALALSLDDAGFTDVRIFESGSSSSELGVGINVLPHAVRELTELGLLSALEGSAVATAELAYHSTHGIRIWGEPRGRAAGYRWPQLSIHRGALLRTLADAVLDRLGADAVSFSHRFTGLAQTADRVTASFVEPGSGAALPDVEGAVLVGCDGVHSVVRGLLVADEGPPLWNGITMWRGVTRAPTMLTGATMIMAGHFARRMVVYPIEPAVDGDQLINWVAEHKGDEARPMPPQDWSHEVDREAVLEVFGDFDFDFYDLTSLVHRADAVYQYPMVDREPLTTWRNGLATLLGDAAHPMYPVGSNGASQAILDARHLARALATESDTGDALDRYEAERLPPTAAIVRANRQVGPERCMEIVHERAPDGFDRVEDVISQRELEEISAAYRKTAGFAVEELNQRTSLSVEA
ncbi:MAG: flavin-dependent oxidoreductase [Actinomycetota bacterium]